MNGQSFPKGLCCNSSPNSNIGNFLLLHINDNPWNWWTFPFVLFYGCEVVFIPGINLFGFETPFYLYIAEDLLIYYLDFCVYFHERYSPEISLPCKFLSNFCDKLRSITSFVFSVRLFPPKSLLYFS